MRRERKKQIDQRKAVIYFLAAFFSVFFGLLAVVYLEVGKNALYITILPILKRAIAAIVLLCIAVGIRNVLKKPICKVIAVGFMILLAIGFSWHISGIREEKSLKPYNLTLQSKEFKRYDIEGDHFTVREARPYMVKRIDVSYLDNIKIYFSEPLPQDMTVRVRYTTQEVRGFDTERKSVIRAHKGDTVAKLPVNVAHVRSVRFNFGMKIGNQFSLDRIEINGDYAERIHNKEQDMLLSLVLFLLLPCAYLLLANAQDIQKKTDDNLLLKILSFPFAVLMPLSIFITLLVKYLVDWVKTTCGDVSFSIIVLQLSSPIKGTDSAIIKDIIKSAVLPPVIITIVAVLFYMFIVRAMFALKDIPVKRIPRWSKIIVEAVTVIILINTVQVQGERVGIWEYVKNIKEVSTLYEKEYIDPENTDLTFPQKKRNLIYIFMESMESSYSDQKDGGAMNHNYIPNLTKLARENVSFSDKEKGLGGSVCLESTAYTVGGLVAQTSGINLKLMNSGSMFGEFLPGITTMGDILNKEGYNQVFLCGSEGDFAGRDTYFKSHKNYKIEDYEAAKKEGDIPEDYRVFWGHEDEILYKRAKKQLTELSSKDAPFNLTMLTVDTHFPKGYKCKLCKDIYPTQYANVIACADQQVYDFVQWIKNQDFYKNTTIVIAGDHTSMVDTGDKFWSDMESGYKRTVYNTIINPQCTYTEQVTKKRNFSTMDMFPTTLAALGVKIDGNRLGLGTNLFSGEKTLPEKFGTKYLNQELGKNDKKYNEFY